MRKRFGRAIRIRVAVSGALPPGLLVMAAAVLLSAACSGGAQRQSSFTEQSGAPASSTDESHAGERTVGGDISLADLPAEARRTLELIRHGGPFPYAKDGTVFRNREGQLPRKPLGYYHEYTVPTPRAKDRGARRIIAGESGEYYYTRDHYQSFRRIRE